MSPRTETISTLLRQFPAWANTTAEVLQRLIDTELGHDPKAWRAPQTGLLICAGNLAIGAWQALIRMVLVGVPHIRVKLPSSAEARSIAAFGDALLEAGLVQELHHQLELEEGWIEQSELLIVMGSDETIATFRAQIQPGQLFIGHGHKVSIGVVLPEDVTLDCAARAAKDLIQYDQTGCLSPHLFYVMGDSARFAEDLAEQLALELADVPDWPIDLAARVCSARMAARFRGCTLHAPLGSTAWTVIHDSDPTFRPSCLGRLAYVKPCQSREHLETLLLPLKGSLSTVGLSRPTTVNCDASRFCPLGEMQFPDPFWQQDGYRPLASLVFYTKTAEKPDAGRDEP